MPVSWSKAHSKSPPLPGPALAWPGPGRPGPAHAVEEDRGTRHEARSLYGPIGVEVGRGVVAPAEDDAPLGAVEEHGPGRRPGPANARRPRHVDLRRVERRQ